MNEPFYVGYLPLPKALRRPLGLIVLALIVADAALALVLVLAQPVPASGAWGSDGEVQYDGRLEVRPYPVLRLADGSAVLLVSVGKHGAPDGLEPLDGQHVAVAGYPIRRGDVTVLQLDQMPTATDGAAPPTPTPNVRTAILTGEIVDAKCWTGAMVPGDGKAHKGCGAFCLLGGVPALFIADAPGGGANWYLLAGPDGGPIPDEARTLVGERVTLTGIVSAEPGLARLTVMGGF